MGYDEGEESDSDDEDDYDDEDSYDSMAGDDDDDSLSRVKTKGLSPADQEILKKYL
ncbi:hypothetical protein AaE_001519, partial [Aphanomyces astaci]